MLTGIAVLGLALPLLAQDAKVGKEYYIAIQSEQTNQYKAPTVRQKVGSVVFDVPNAKKAEKHHVKVGDIKSNQYTGSKQTSGDFNQGRGNGKGMCSAAP